MQHGPISEVHWLDQQYSDDVQDLVQADENLVHAMKQLASITRPEPEMNWFGMHGTWICFVIS